MTWPTVDANLIQVILEWAWKQREMQAAIRQAYRLDGGIATETLRQPFFDLVASWLAGDRFVGLATRSDLSIDDVLGVHTHVVTFVLQTLVEQGVALLERLLAAQGAVMSGAVRALPDHLRFGVPTEAARLLASKGVRHRRASIELGREMGGFDVAALSRAALFGLANPDAGGCPGSMDDSPRASRRPRKHSSRLELAPTAPFAPLGHTSFTHAKLSRRAVSRPSGKIGRCKDWLHDPESCLPSW